MDEATNNSSGSGRRALLLHACCGPCSTHCVKTLREGGVEPVVFYSNSNMDSREEFDKRLAALRSFAAAVGVEVIADEYDHAAWLRAVAGLEGEKEGGRRCDACFRHNLGRAAQAAARLGLPAFATTLTVSPHKNSARVFAAGRNAASAVRGTEFRELDFKKRGGFLESVRLSREYGLYRQSWCGCEFSRSEAEARAARRLAADQSRSETGPEKSNAGAPAPESRRANASGESA